jgi:hypothetical protein
MAEPSLTPQKGDLKQFLNHKKIKRAALISGPFIKLFNYYLGPPPRHTPSLMPI